jgi:hypothetical protein
MPALGLFSRDKTMPRLLKIIIGSTALIAIAAAQGQIVPSTRTCTKNSGKDHRKEGSPST